MSALGSLVVRLGLDAAEFVSGMDASQLKAAKFAKDVEKGLQSVVAGFGAVVTAAGGYLVVADQLVTSLSDYQELADLMGDTAEQVASLRDAADLSGTAMDRVAAASVKLTSTLSAGGNVTKEMGSALKKIGVDLADFQKQGPAQQLETVAKALAGFEDGAGKTAAAVALFGKEGAAMIPFLKDLEETGGRNVVLMQEQIDAADEYAKAKARLTIQLRSFAEFAAGSVAPVLNNLATAATNVARQMIGIDNEAAALRTKGDLKEWAEGAVNLLSFVLDGANGIVRVFKLIGLAVGSLAAQGVAMAKMQWAEAAALREDFAADAQKLLTDDLAGQAIRKEMARLTAAARAAAEGPPVPSNLRSLSATDFQSKAGTGTPKKDRTDEAAQRYIDSLNGQIDKARELTALEQALADLRSDKLAGASQQLRDRILAQATLVDLYKDQKKVADQAAEAEKRRAAIYEEAAIEAGRIREANMGPLEKTSALVERIRYLEEQRLLTTEDADNAIARAWDSVLKGTEERVNQVNEFVAQARANMQTILGNAIADAVFGRFDDGLKGMLRKWAEAMAQMAAQVAAARILGAFFGPVGGVAGGAAAGAAAGGRANGGPVFAGQSVLVGERGPEVLTMGGAGGHITPIAKASAGPIEINTVVQVGDGGTRSTRNGEGADMAGLATTIQQMVTAAVAKEMQQGGVIWKRQMGY